MNINRDNYEHWLLLYIDRELSAADKEAFEAFAAANPDVQDELELYNQTILAPDDTICFSGIANLLQPEVWDENQISPLQEALLQKLDGNLEYEQLQLLDRQIDTDPLLQKEWALLRQVKLEAEMPAEMPDKTVLLHEEKNNRIVPLKWMVRVTAAAAVLVSGWLLLPNLVGHKQPATATASVTPAVKQNEPANNRSISNNPSGEFSAFDSAANNQGPVTMTTAKKLQTGISIDNNLQKKAKDIPAEAIATTTNGAAVMGNTNPVNVTNVQHDNLETALTATTHVALRNEVVIPAETAGLTEKAVEAIQTQQLQLQISQPEAETNPVALAATWEEPDNDIISIAGARINKQKLRGVYRSITRPLARVFEKKPEPGTIAAK